ncbi:MAG: hypothetical protein GXO88_04990, partial [Chlorobi bacterium]|nr:hypothetical protein [Chlorobiota bacterium]
TETAPVSYFPVLEVSGSNYEIGKAIGSTFKLQITELFDRSSEIYSYIESFIAQDTNKYYYSFLDKVQANYPQFVEELQGMADGSGFPLKKFMIYSTFSEYVALLQNPQVRNLTGCSSVSYFENGKFFLAHNEDGAPIFNDIMFIVKARPTDKPAFISFCYPGMLMGVAPSMNDHGIFYSGNYISGKQINIGGIPNSFIQRSLMEATNMDEAIAKATIPDRAYCFHVNIASYSDQKMVGIEVAPSKYYIQQVDGWYVHTNHFFQTGMDSLCYEDLNSLSRYELLTSLANDYSVNSVPAEGSLLTDFLSSHENSPDSPCAHGASNGITGQTLGSTLFDINEGSWRISYGNPCERKFQEIKF